MKKRTPLRTFVDWYVNKYQAENYIHISRIQNEISKRIDNAVKRNDEVWCKKLEESELKLQREYKIIEDGYCAEIESMEKIVSDARELKKEVTELDFIVKRKAHELVLLTAEMKQERKDFINSKAITMGKMNDFINKSENLLIETEKEKQIREKI